MIARCSRLVGVVSLDNGDIEAAIELPYRRELHIVGEQRGPVSGVPE